MDRKNLLRIAYHENLEETHHELGRSALNQAAKRLESTLDLGVLERFDRIFDMLSPLFRPVKLRGSGIGAWQATPEVTVVGKVDDKKVKVGLSFNTQGPADQPSIHPWANRKVEKGPYETRGGLPWVNRHFCELWQRSRPDDPLGDLDHVEELVDLYFKEVGKLSPRELKALGFPAEFTPEDTQLSFDDISEAAPA